MEPETKVGICCGSFCTILVVGAILLGESYDLVNPNEVGLIYDGNLHTLVDSESWAQGRHFVGIGRSFIKFSTLEHTIKYTGSDIISTRTMDGLRVTMDVTFQYKLKTSADSLSWIYSNYAYDWHPIYMKIGRSILRNVVAEYKAFWLVSRRHELAAQMQIELKAQLGAAGAKVISLQLISITIPTSIEDAIIATVIAQQDVETATSEKAIATISAATSLIEAKVLAETIMLSANATAEQSLLEANAEAAKTKQIAHWRTQAYAAFRENVRASSDGDDEYKIGNFSGADLLSYVWMQNAMTDSSGFDSVMLGTSIPGAIGG